MSWYLAATLIGANLIVAILRPHRWVYPLLVKRRDLEDRERFAPVLRELDLMETETRPAPTRLRSEVSEAIRICWVGASFWLVILALIHLLL